MAGRLREADLLSAITKRPDIRLFLMFGTDEGLAEDIARRLGAAMGEEAERVDIEGSELRSDPARLADEAASSSLFGGERYIRIRVSRDDALAAIENLLLAEKTHNPVIATAGNLTKANKLRKLAEGSPLAMSLACYPPDAGDAMAQIRRIATAEGLRLDDAAVRLLHGATNGDRILAGHEIEKLVLYTDASPDNPQTVDADVLTALSAGNSEENLSALIDAVLCGKMKTLGREFSDADFVGLNPVRIVKALQAKTAQLSALQAKMPPRADIMQFVRSERSVFFKEQASVADALRRWNRPRLVALNRRLLELERELMHAPAGATKVLLERGLAGIAAVSARG